MTSGPIPVTAALLVRSRSRIRRRRLRTGSVALTAVVLIAGVGTLGSALRRDGSAGAPGAAGIPEILGIVGHSKARGGSADPGNSDGPFAGQYVGRALRPDLAAALRSATEAAAHQGFSLVVTSGFRSWQAQQRLFDQAVRRYGGAVEAARWVLPPERSQHVQGAAVDVGDRAAAGWLEANGSTWGLCRRYENEWWHFELLTSPGGSCPAPAPSAGG